MKRALVLGLNQYDKLSDLNGCINDAKNIEALISRNADGSKNFDTKTVTTENGPITVKDLRKHIVELFATPAEMAFFYFAGHGTATNLGGYLCTTETGDSYNEGFPLQELLNAIHTCSIPEVIIILDCCQSGSLGNAPSLPANAVTIREGVSILTASRADESAMEVNGSGVFTSLVCDALAGGASDLLGTVTPAGVYAHVEQSFGAWDQRPLFKSFVSRSTPLRKAPNKIDISLFPKLLELFPASEFIHPLDRTYEVTEATAIKENVVKFKTLKKFQTAGLIQVNHQPDPDMYWACLENESCQLTPLGKFYWHLTNSKKI